MTSIYYKIHNEFTARIGSQARKQIIISVAIEIRREIVELIWRQSRFHFEIQEFLKEIP